MKMHWLGIGLSMALALAQGATAQPMNGCPMGQAMQSSDPSGNNVTCVTIPDVGALQTQLGERITAETNARLEMNAMLMAAIQEEAAARQAAIQALQEGANSPATRCYAAHIVRSAGTEMRFTVISLNNGDTQNAAVIERLTIRDGDGTVLHDSGPKIGIPHPLAQGTIPARNFTIVPPGAHFAISTTDIWGFGIVPTHAGRGNELISMQVEVSKPGKRSLFQVSSREITRERVLLPTGSFTVGAERAGTMAPCFPVDPG